MQTDLPGGLPTDSQPMELVKECTPDLTCPSPPADYQQPPPAVELVRECMYPGTPLCRLSAVGPACGAGQSAEGVPLPGAAGHHRLGAGPHRRAADALQELPPAAQPLRRVSSADCNEVWVPQSARGVNTSDRSGAWEPTDRSDV